MDAMALAQLKRQQAWYEQEVKHSDRDLKMANLALETAKKNADDLKKKHTENKRKLDMLTQDIARANEQSRKEYANRRREG
jgi:predicted  nucleic acid-binding Zn-ribbon protein